MMKHSHVRLMETLANFNDVIENWGDVSVSTSIANTNTNTNTSNIDRSSQSTNIDSSQQNVSETNTNTSTNISSQTSTQTSVDNSTVSNISSNSTTSNVDQSTSSIVNDSSSTVNNIMKCGLDASGAKDLIANINDSINISNNASNSFIVTGNNNTISDIKLQSMLQSYGPTVDKSCVQRALTESQTRQEVSNSGSKSQKGADFKSDLTTGGNVSGTSNTTVTEQSGKTGVESTSAAKGVSSATAENAVQQLTSTDVGVTNTTKQTTTAGGINEVNTFFVIVIITFAVLFYMEKYQGLKLYSDVLDNIKGYYHIYLLALVFILSYLYNLRQ